MPLQRAVRISAALLEHIGPLARLMAQEWAGYAFFEGFVEGRAFPRPLSAVDDHGEVVGGLAFTAHEHPTLAMPALWIDAVAVATLHRRQGIATALVREACAVASAQGFGEVFAYTGVPGLYRRLGWRGSSAPGPFEVMAVAL